MFVSIFSFFIFSTFLFVIKLFFCSCKHIITFNQDRTCPILKIFSKNLISRKSNALRLCIAARWRLFKLLFSFQKALPQKSLNKNRTQLLISAFIEKFHLTYVLGMLILDHTDCFYASVSTRERPNRTPRRISRARSGRSQAP